MSHDAHWNDTVLLETFAEWEPDEQTRGGSYREVLNRVLKRFGTRLGFVPTDVQLAEFEECIARAKPFADTVEALKVLSEMFQLAIISNTDDDLFAITATNLEVPFAHTITAEQVGTYKPNPLMFEQALERFNCPKAKVLHVAQSLFHDVQPANQLGIATVWIDRTGGKPGATMPSNAKPDWSFSSLEELVHALQQN